MERELSFIKVDQYLKSLTERNVDLQDYCSTSVFELRDKIASTDGVKSPILVFIGYQCKLDGNSQRTFNIRTISFSILFSGVGVDDFEAQRNAENSAEAIGLEILSRIHVDSKVPTSAWLYNNFLKESVGYSAVEQEGQDSFFGMDFHFDLKVPEPLVVDVSKWSDAPEFCFH
jgi:hypothetical protein